MTADARPEQGAPGPLSAEELGALLLRNPMHRWLGLEVVAADADGCEILARPPEDIVINPERGHVHGGILATLVDTTADYALAARFGRPFPTIDMRVDYHRAAPPGGLRAVGTILRAGGTLSTAEARIYAMDGTLCASGRGVYFTAGAKAAPKG